MRRKRTAPRGAARRPTAHDDHQITVRGIDSDLNRMLKEEAERMSTSVNQLTLRLLRRSFGLEPSPPAAGHDDLDHLAGAWSDDDARAFDDELRLQRKVDPKLWK